MASNYSVQSIIHYEIINKYAYAAAIPFSIIGFIANILLLYIIRSDRYFDKMTYHLIQISVISDLISLFCAITGFSLVAGVHIEYDIGSVLCKLLLFVIYISYGISITTLCLISIDRYLAIVKPLSVVSRKYKKKLIHLGLYVGCMITLSISLPILIVANVYSNSSKFCDVPNITESTTTYLILQTIFLYILPALILLITYGKIVKFQSAYVQPGQRKNQVLQNGRHLMKKKFIRTLIIITLTYLLTAWPFFATCLGMAITAKSLLQIRTLGLEYYILAFFSFTSTIGISIINPFIYFKFDSNIKNKLIRKFGHYFSIHLANIDSTVNAPQTSQCNSHAIKILHVNSQPRHLLYSRS